jgi:hypothetical protein
MEIKTLFKMHTEMQIRICKHFERKRKEEEGDSRQVVA